MRRSDARTSAAKHAIICVCLALSWLACDGEDPQPPTGPDPIAPPSARITEPRNGATVNAPVVAASGTFMPPGLGDSREIWVLVWPELAGGKAFPQSPNSSRGDAAILDRANHTWSLPISLGGPNQRYRVSVHTADLGASRALRDGLIDAARTAMFPGLFPDQLPQNGFVEHDSVTIVKLEPPISMQVTEPRDGAVVPTSTTVVRGTYAPQSLVDDRTIWVLVWPALAGGKGYPQSPNAAAGDPATIMRSTQMWSSAVALGGPPQSYRISVHTADADATTVLRERPATAVQRPRRKRSPVVPGRRRRAREA